MREWQNRPLDPVYPVVFFDALRVKIRDEGLVKNKAVYVALALNPDGEKDVLGLWIEQTEGAKFWLKVVNELKARGVNDILIAVVDGLKGFPEAITTAFPQTTVQTCIVHLIRNSLAFVSWKDRKAILPAIKAIYRAETADIALLRIEEFEAEWGKRYPAVGAAWRRAWDYVVPFFAFAPGIRKMTAEFGAHGFEDVVAAINPIPDGDVDTPAYWGVTFGADDADAVNRKARELGAEVVVPPFDAPFARITVLRDPQGATFTVSQFVPENKDVAP